MLNLKTEKFAPSLGLKNFKKHLYIGFRKESGKIASISDQVGFKYENRT